VIRAWVKENIAGSDRRAAWASIVSQWLDLLNEALGGSYRTQQSDRVLLFAPADYGDAESLLDCAESGLTYIVDLLGSVTGRNWQGPLVMLLFADPETYCRYVSPFDPEGEYFRSGGMCLRQGYLHLALRPTLLDQLRISAVHEITHACLSHLSLPLWLEEGIAQLVQQAATPSWAQFALDGQTAGEIRQYWREHGLQDFWWGQGFFRDDEGQGHSYALAEVLYRLLVADHRRQLPDFIRNAHAADAGDSAARTSLGKGVAVIAAQFLGPGAWEPMPPDAPAWVRRGVLYLSRKQYARAIGDFEEALRCSPRLAVACTNRGFARSQLGQLLEAIADYEQAIQLDPLDFTAHNNLAWILATCSQEVYRNGQRALDHANKACELTRFTEWYCLGTLAAAHAEVEDFKEARRYAKEALRLAPPDEQAGCQGRLRLYVQRKPYREESPPIEEPPGRKT